MKIIPEPMKLIPLPEAGNSVRTSIWLISSGYRFVRSAGAENVYRKTGVRSWPRTPKPIFDEFGTVIRLDHPDWLKRLEGYENARKTPGIDHHVYRILFSEDRLRVPWSVAQHLPDSRNCSMPFAERLPIPANIFRLKSAGRD